MILRMPIQISEMGKFSISMAMVIAPWVMGGRSKHKFI